MLLSDWVSDWIDLRSCGLSARTLESYRSLLSLHIAPAIGAVPLDGLCPDQVQRLLAALCAAGHARTAQLVLVLLRASLRDALIAGYIAADPTARIMRPRHTRADPRWWSVEEAQRFIAFAPSCRWGHAWLLALLCGLRRGELAGLQWADMPQLALSGNVICHIRHNRQRIDGLGVVDLPPKSAAGRRDVPIPPQLIPVLRAARRAQAAQEAAGGVLPLYVVSYMDNRPIDPHALNRALSEDIARAGLRQINLHGLRHTMASSAVAAGVDIKILQSILGHANYSTTADIYAHVNLADQSQAISALVQRLNVML